MRSVDQIAEPQLPTNRDHSWSISDSSINQSTDPSVSSSPEKKDGSHGDSDAREKCRELGRQALGYVLRQDGFLLSTTAYKNGTHRREQGVVCSVSHGGNDCAVR